MHFKRNSLSIFRHILLIEKFLWCHTKTQHTHTNPVFIFIHILSFNENQKLFCPTLYGFMNYFIGYISLNFCQINLFIFLKNRLRKVRKTDKFFKKGKIAFLWGNRFFVKESMLLMENIFFFHSKKFKEYKLVSTCRL